MSRGLRAAIDGLRVKPRLFVDEWAAKFRYLGVGSLRSGKWSHNFTPYLVEPMRAVISSAWDMVVLAWAAQLGKSELILNTLGRFIHLEPRTMLLFQPTDKLAKRWGKIRVPDMLNSSSVLRAVTPTRRREDTIKFTNGATLFMDGAGSPVNLSSTAAAVLMMDEIDRYPISVGNTGQEEGDPVELALRRTRTFGNEASIVMSSTPTTLQTSRIWRYYMAGTQERYFMPCVHCGEATMFDIEKMLRHGKSAGYPCVHCGGFIEQKHRGQMLKEGEWRPESKETAASKIRSFNLNAAHSPAVDWADLIDEREAAIADPSALMRSYVNTTLGLPYDEPQEDSIDDLDLASAGAGLPDGVLPQECHTLFAGVDIQKDRIEYSIVGLCGDAENAMTPFVVRHAVIPISPGQSAAWDELLAIFDEKFEYQSGRETAKIYAMMIDTGYLDRSVQAFIARNPRRRIIGVRGSHTPQKNIVGHQVGTAKKKKRGRPSRAEQMSRRLAAATYIDTGQIKDIVSLLATARRIRFNDDLTEDYFSQLTAERKVLRHPRGLPEYRWELVKGRRNEALDCLVYAMSGIWLLNFNVNDWLLRAAARKSAPKNKKGAGRPKGQQNKPAQNAAPQPTRRRPRVKMVNKSDNK